MKQLLGSELAGFIKERQAKQVRSLIQSKNIHPKLAIVANSDNPTITTYINLKKRYGNELGVEVEDFHVQKQDLISTIKALNSNKTVHGIIVQLPLLDTSITDEVLATVDTQKDVDGLAPNTVFDAATPIAINWLLSGFNIDLVAKNIVIVGNGKLVGAPLNRMWLNSGYNCQVVDADTPSKEEIIKNADILVTAVGKPGLITSNIVKQGAILVDAGVASEKGVLKGDVADDVYEREDIIMTPKKGGVGPLTVCALFDNVIRSCLSTSLE